MTGFPFPLAFILSFGLSVSGQDVLLTRDSCKSKFHDLNLNECSVKELGMEFQRLKKLNSHDCDHFESDLHKIMSLLGNSIGKSGFTRSEVLNTIGIPDSTDGSLVPDLMKLEENEEIMIYFWRGWHDFLYIVIRNGKVSRTNWWFAFE